MKDANQPNIVCIGGGTGTFVVLKGLKFFPYNLSVIVTMSDSGGSNKRIRDEFGLLPTSDIRQCLVALSDEKREAGLMRKLFMYRFEKGEGLTGMTFGNLFMAALADILGSQKEAIKQTGHVLRIKGKIIPVTYTDTNLYAKYEDQSVVSEEHLIDEPRHDGKLKISQVYLKPRAVANPDSLDVIKNADMIVLGPGDLFTSLIPNLLVDGICEAISQSKAIKVFVMNLMTKYGQTYGFTGRDHIKWLEKYLGPKPFDYVVMNSAPLNQKALELYAQTQEIPVADDFNGETGYKVVRAEVVGPGIAGKPKSDSLVRSLIRHDSDELALVLHKILVNEL